MRTYRVARGAFAQGLPRSEAPTGGSKQAQSDTTTTVVSSRRMIVPPTRHIPYPPRAFLAFTELRILLGKGVVSMTLHLLLALPAE